jgi:hypothetical protein
MAYKGSGGSGCAEGTDKKVGPLPTSIRTSKCEAQHFSSWQFLTILDFIAASSPVSNRFRNKLSSYEVVQNHTMDKRASQGLSLQVPTQPLVNVDPVRYRTFWARAKRLGRSATKKGSLVIENSIPTPVCTNKSESSWYGDAEQTSEPDPEVESLPPCDGGRRAWACLLGAATIEGLIWGMYPP